MPPETSEHKQIKKYLKENKKILEENNVLLKKIYRNAKWELWLRVIWYALLLGIPFALYFLFAPIFTAYFNALGADYDKFQEGIRELPGFKGFENTVEGE